MSRIGKQSINLPEGVAVTAAADNLVTVTGPLGSLSRSFDPRVTLTVRDNAATLQPKPLNLETNMLWGTFASHLRNMIEGVTKGFQKQLTLEGVGYRVSLAGDKLTFTLGFSHPINCFLPPGIKAAVDKNNLTISGIDKELVGRVAAEIRDYKPPEPYKGKGIRYLDETVRRKAGKKVTA